MGAVLILNIENRKLYQLSFCEVEILDDLYAVRDIPGFSVLCLHYVWDLGRLLCMTTGDISHQKRKARCEVFSGMIAEA